jgi:hypothetical protein
MGVEYDEVLGYTNYRNNFYAHLHSSMIFILLYYINYDTYVLCWVTAW